MPFDTESFGADEPPPSEDVTLTDRISRAVLLVLCTSPVVLFPVALAVRVVRYYFP